MAGALVAFSVIAVSIRALAGTLNVFEILAIRSGSGLTILLIILLVQPRLRSEIVPRRMALHLVRNSFHFCGQYAWTLGLTLLPFATVFALEFTAPAWVTLLAVFLLHERLTTSRIGAVILGFLGILLILRPGLESFRPEALIVLLAALLFANAIIATKKLTADVSTFAILFWMNVLHLPMALAGSDWLFLQKIEIWQLPWVAGVAVAGLCANFFTSNAFRVGDATVIVPIDFLRVPLIAVVGWLFYGEALDVFVFAGAGLIFLGLLWNLHAETRPTIPMVGQG